ncbi:MAG TPA: DUF2089 domain-containing protein [Firmicutes bacterium]|nr:DUF2089 domain-containing protein [Bacillota bacterium]
MRKRPAPGTCPVCGERMHLTRLACETCGSSLEGRFELCRFCRLTPEQQQFVEVFLVNRGNIREMERVLGISYPTVRSRLDAIIETLGYTVNREDQVDQEKRRAILEALEKGELSVSEALQRLKS